MPHSFLRRTLTDETDVLGPDIKRNNPVLVCKEAQNYILQWRACINCFLWRRTIRFDAVDVQERYDLKPTVAVRDTPVMIICSSQRA